MSPVLVVRRGALGDSICFLPILVAARATWPQARLEFAGNGEVAALFEARAVVDRGLSSEDLALWRGAEQLTRYDIVVGDVEGSSVRFAVVADEKTRTPVARQLLERAATVWPEAWPAVDPRPRLPRSSSALPDLVWLHPGSGSPRKNWPCFAAVAELALAAGMQVVASFGEADEALAERLAQELPEAVQQRSGQSLDSLAGGLEQATVYVGNDSGVTHLAAALGVPTVAVFGAASSAVWQPERARVLPFESSPDEVWTAAAGLARTDAR